MLKKSVGWIFIIAITILALFLRITPVINKPETRRGGLGPYADPKLYHELAYNLLSGKAYSVSRGQKLEPVIMRAPGYPLFLSLSYHLIGVRPGIPVADWNSVWMNVRTIQCFLDASLCIGLYLLALLIFSKHFWLGILSALFQCFNFFSIHYTSALLSESLAAFLLIWSLVLLLWGWKKKYLLVLILSGIFLGLLALTRPEYLPWVVIIPCLIVFFRRIPFLERLAIILLVWVGSSAVILPWSYRNYLAFDDFILISSGNLGENLYRGSFEGNFSWKGWSYLPREIYENPAEENKAKQMLREYLYLQAYGTEDIRLYDKFFLDQAIIRINKNFQEVLSAWLKNIPRLWYQNYVQMFQDPEPSGRFILFWYTLAGFIFLLDKKHVFFLLPLILLPLYLTCLYLPLHIEPRYSVPASPVLAALAGFGLGAILIRIKRILIFLFPCGIQIKGIRNNL